MNYPAFETYLKNQKEQARKRTLAVIAMFALVGIFASQFLNIINVLACRPVVTQGILTVTKVVKNDNGGTAGVSDFTLYVGQTQVTSGVNNYFDEGTYMISESGGPDGYHATFSGDCCLNGNLTIEAGESYACTITNDDQPGTLHVKKIVVNDNNGVKQPQDFSFSINGGDAIAFESDGQNDLTLDAGIYNISETAVSGYTSDYNNCSNIEIINGGEASCTITNNDIAPTPLPQADMSVQKSVDSQNPQSGQTVSFTIVATNLGPDSAASIQLNDLLPSGLTFVSASSTKGMYDSAIGIWSIGDMVKDETETLKLESTVNGEPGTIIVNNAAINIDIDSIISNNTASTSLTIASPPPSPSAEPNPTETPSPAPGPGSSVVTVTTGGGRGGNGPLPESNAYENWLKQNQAIPVGQVAGTSTLPVPISPTPVVQGEVKGVSSLPATGFDLTEVIALVTILLSISITLLLIRQELSLSKLTQQN